MAHVAASLGRFAAGTFVRDVADFAREVQLGTGMEQFVHMVCHMRRATIRRRRMLHDMLSVDLGQAAAPRWFWPLMEQGFSLYCLVRQRASPRQRQPQVQASAALYVSRALQRRLTLRGVHSGTVHSAAESGCP